MKRIAVLAVLVMHLLQCVSQPVFEGIYTAGISYTMSLNELASGNILAGISGAGLFNKNGAVLSHTGYWGENLVQISSIRKHSDNEYFFATGYRHDDCGSGSGLRIDPAIGEMDSLGNVTSFKYYSSNDRCNRMTADLIISEEKDVITWGRGKNPFLLFVDSTGAPVWEQRINRSAGIQFVKALPSGELLIGMNMDTAGAVVARMGLDGNFIWARSYVRPKGVLQDAIVESDDSFLVTGYTDSASTTDIFTPLPPNFKPKLFLMKLNGTGDVLWCKGYDSEPNYWNTPSSAQLAQLNNGTYALLATSGYATSNLFYRPILIKTDQNGDTLWTSSVGRSEYDYYARDLLVCTDGGLMFSGGISGELPEQNTGLPYIFKVDSLGHFSCWEQRPEIEVLDLFPVDSSFTLSASLVENEVHLGSIRDTIYSEVVVYSGCDFSTGLPRTELLSRKPRVYPNPNTGQFTVEFEDPLVKDTYYSVYDAMGKLLFQRAAAHGKKTEVVDLSGYGPGTYVIRFTDPAGVCYERVVVE